MLGESDSFSITEETLSLDIETQSLLTLTAINAGKLQQQSAVENSFVSEVVSNSALPLGKGLWVTDAVSGNVKNALAFSRAKTIFNHNGKAVKGVLTISAVNDQINETLAAFKVIVATFAITYPRPSPKPLSMTAPIPSIAC